jgi:hypothetical protein
MLPAESKLKILENFYGLDLAIFRKPLSSVETCCPILKEEYTIAKGALLSLMIEMLDYLEHKPEQITEKEVPDTTGLQKLALESARVAIDKAKKEMLTESSKQSILKSVTESVQRLKTDKENVDLESLMNESVKNKILKTSVDNLLLLDALKECNSRDNIRTAKGQTLFEAYRVLRDNLISVAREVVEG